MPNYQKIKSDLAAQAAGQSLDEALITLNNLQIAPTAGTTVDVDRQTFEHILASSGELGMYRYLMATNPNLTGWTIPSGFTAAEVMSVIFNALSVLDSQNLNVFATSDVTVGLPAYEAGLSLLNAVTNGTTKLLSDASKAALIAATVAQSIPEYNPPLTYGDLQTAQAQP